MKGIRSHPNPALRHWRFDPSAPSPNLWYRFMRRVFQATMTPLWKIRVFNRHVEPTTGSAVYICNHQSFLDPMLMSFALRRPMNYMARDSLFRNRVFRFLIQSLNAFPVRRGKADSAALKEAMRRLRSGGQVVVFAEGTRTTDGRIGPFLPGVALLAQRAADWTVPVLIDGAYEAWPRSQKLPSPGKVTVQYGRPISRDEARKHSAQELVDRVRDELIEIQHDVRHRTGRGPLDYQETPEPAAS
jgi:1-acyl-sn-glycerol-3-phosphate acyltransferase